MSTEITQLQIAIEVTTDIYRTICLSLFKFMNTSPPYQYNITIV